MYRCSELCTQGEWGVHYFLLLYTCDGLARNWPSVSNLQCHAITISPSLICVRWFLFPLWFRPPSFIIHERQNETSTLTPSLWASQSERMGSNYKHTDCNSIFHPSLSFSLYPAPRSQYSTDSGESFTEMPHVFLSSCCESWGSLSDLRSFLICLQSNFGPWYRISGL